MAEDDPHVGDALRIANNLPDFGSPNVEANNAVFYKRHVAQEAASKDLRDALAETWPARLAKDVYSAAQLPGDVYAGRTDPMSDEGIKRAIDLAGTVVGGPMPFAKGNVLGTSGGKIFQPVGQTPRELNALGMYSHGAETARNLPQPKGHPDQYKAMLLKGGVKPDELAAANWDELATKPIVTRDDVAARFRDPGVEETVLQRSTTPHALAEKQGLNWTDLSPYQRDPLIEKANSINSTPTKYHDYQIPGGENYREVLLKAPEHLPGKYGPMDQIPMGDKYQSSHWEDPNVIAHMRMSDRTGPNNEKILHIEELQSDWAQEGRKRGFKPDPLSSDETKRLYELRDTAGRDSLHPNYEEYRALANKAHEASEGIPKGPYVDSTQKWTDLGLKRALMEAAKGGYDKMIWTPGAEQAKRYSLSNKFDRIGYDPKEQYLYGKWKGDGDFGERDIGIYPPNKLPELLGQETAQRLLSATPNKRGHHDLSGVDLEFGGEGMKGYYDKIVPTQLSKLVKKLDPEAKIGTHGLNRKELHTLAHEYSQRNPEAEQAFNHMFPNDGLDAKKYIDFLEKDPYYSHDFRDYRDRGSQQFPSIQITPRMREQILKGFPHYASGGAVTQEPTLPMNTTPSEAQKAAGNYKKAHLVFHGLEVSIENPKGSERNGVAPNGRKWSVTMPAHYGYIKSTVGADKDHVDVYIGHNRKSDRVFVIDQCDHNTGKFDETKVMLGYDQKSEAVKDYCSAFSDGKGKKRIAAVHEISMDQLKSWLKTKYTLKAFEKSPPRFH